ncbi:type IV pilus biogenesis protein PilP [Undibacterium sp. SXout7W]|uniref:type IV pilus biogenesis protein PilP n=1 Tax=Undibacterium sp. SXout7W TaxID=3413049 RepID=UPI003BF4580B
MTRIETETLILKAREKQLDVQAKILARQSEITSKQTESDRITQSPALGNPVIVSIEGIGKVMFATLQMDGGNLLDVQVGDELPNGMKVASIRANEVIIENHKKKRIRLATATQAPVTFDSSYPSVGLRLPPLAPPTAFKGATK